MEKIGVLGTGMVGSAIATKLIALGYPVKMGSRTAGNEKASAWAAGKGEKASTGTFADAAQYGDILINCGKGEQSLEIIRMAGIENFTNKLLIDIANPLDGSAGFPPTLSVCNTSSLAEQIQELLPRAKVVKTLNIVNCNVMVDPSLSGGEPTMFLSGNDNEAKQRTRKLLESFGWKDILDLGDITTARGPEMMLPIWLRTYMATKNGYVAFKLLQPKTENK